MKSLFETRERTDSDCKSSSPSQHSEKKIKTFFCDFTRETDPRTVWMRENLFHKSVYWIKKRRYIFTRNFMSHVNIQSPR